MGSQAEGPVAQSKEQKTTGRGVCEALYRNLLVTRSPITSPEEIKGRGGREICANYLLIVANPSTGWVKISVLQRGIPQAHLPYKS